VAKGKCQIDFYKVFFTVASISDFRLGSITFFLLISAALLEFFEHKRNSKIANEFAQVICQEQADSLGCQRNQPKLTAFSKHLNA
jgi:hypothetical protein